jgi:hypothetical protein
MTDDAPRPAEKPASEQDAAASLGETGMKRSANRTAALLALASVGDLIDDWWNDHFPGSAVARHVPAWNVAHAAMLELKRRLGAL